MNRYDILKGSRMDRYVKRIFSARVYDVAIETPLDLMQRLSRRTGNALFLKREDLQPVFSFKLRGAFNKIVKLSDEEKTRGIICASAGNHAQGVALSAKRLGIRAVIVMPVTTPVIKVDSVRSFGAEIVLYGDAFDDAYLHARKLEAEQGLSFVHPYDDPDVIAGQGTIAMEILRQHPDPIDAVFAAVGGGGLIAGIAAYVKFINPNIKVLLPLFHQRGKLFFQLFQDQKSSRTMQCILSKLMKFDILFISVRILNAGSRTFVIDPALIIIFKKRTGHAPENKVFIFINNKIFFHKCRLLHPQMRRDADNIRSRKKRTE